MGQENWIIIASTGSATISIGKSPTVGFPVVRSNVRFRFATLPRPAGESRTTLAGQMTAEPLFVEGVEEGLRQHEQGQYSRLDDVKRGLGDV